MSTAVPDPGLAAGLDRGVLEQDLRAASVPSRQEPAEPTTVPQNRVRTLVYRRDIRRCQHTRGGGRVPEVDAADTLTSDGQRAYAPTTLIKWVAAITDRHRRANRVRAHPP